MRFDETTNSYTYKGGSNTIEARPSVPIEKGWTLKLGGEATLVANASTGKGQGLWEFTMFGTSLNITTSYQQLKKGAYTGNITWTLVAGPSI